jgi:hypothetical protein
MCKIEPTAEDLALFDKINQMVGGEEN